MNKYQRDMKAVKKVLSNKPRGLQIGEIASKTNLGSYEALYVLKCMIEGDVVTKQLVGKLQVPIYSLNGQ